MDREKQEEKNAEKDEEEEDGEGEGGKVSSRVYREFEELHRQGQGLVLHLQQLRGTLHDKVQLFELTLRGDRERFLRELSDVEGWLREVYRTLRKEPNRPFLPYSRQEVEELKQEYPSSEEEEGESREEGVSGQALITALLSQAQVPGFGREAKISGSSLGSDNCTTSIRTTACTIRRSMWSWRRRVRGAGAAKSDERIPLSSSPPSSPSLSPSSPPIAGESSVDPVGEEWAEGMEEEEEEEGEMDGQTETGSMTSESTVRAGEGAGSKDRLM